MIQKNTIVRVVDNSGAKRAACIHVYNGYRRRYARIGDQILVAIKAAKRKEGKNMKIRKGDTSKALVVSTKSMFNNLKYPLNSVVLISNQQKFVGTRVFMPVTREFRATKYIKLLMIASGVLKK